MKTNHIFLVIGFLRDLRDLAMAQRMIDSGRKLHKDEPAIQSALDEKQAEVIAKKDRIYDQMFEIPRSN